ncbi:33eeb247-c931-448c-a903-a7135f3003c9 [Sclerotinia trifoliorum]|uniref:33eeb247-c931-448c-a903-a7135f3003c9 n=1 Tax=Sclerotinia trifoliorum TaxID=28548 RepID=A0A8H2VTP2_9HELO|nr:33eeb247-c931-448c-a903-a7135f3003c9 [Sclerotinia trifoliorum]
MFPSNFNMQLLAVVTLLLANAFANPIRRSDDETTGARLPGLFGLFTTVATSALTTSELVAIVVISSSTIYIQEPNFFPTTVWSVPEMTPSGTADPITTESSTPYSFSTPFLNYNASTTLLSSTDTVFSTSAPGITDQAQIKVVTTSSCNTDIAGVTIPTSALTTTEFIAVETLCNLTIGQLVATPVICGSVVYIQEPNFYTSKTYNGIPVSAKTTSAVVSCTTRAAIKARMPQARTGHNIPFFDQKRPTSLHQADRNWVKSVPSSVAGNQGARAFRERQG